MVDKMFYNTILSSVFSPCGGYFLVGNIYGDIALYDIKNLPSPGKTSNLQEPIQNSPKYRFKSQDQLQVCSMVSTEHFFITGTVGEISGWDWNSVISGNPKVSWTIPVPSPKDVFDKVEINYLITSSINESNAGMVLFAGCGDHTIYAFSLEDGKCLRSYQGHTNYVHCISTNDTKLASASEDGTVKIWDTRSPVVSNTLKPSEHTDIHRPHLGKWIGAVSINEDWLVCGGGSRLSLWHLRSMNPMVTFSNTEDDGIHVADLYEDRIFAGGSAPFFSELGYNNELYTKIETSSNTIYSCSYSKTPIKLLILAGSSDKIDACTNFNFRDLIFTFS